MHIFWVEIYWGRYGINFKWAKNHLWCLTSSMKTVQQITFLLTFLCLPPGCQLILGQKSCKHIVFTPQTCCYSACRQDIPVLFMDFYRCCLTSCSTSSPRRSSVGPDLSDKQQTAICNNLWKLCSQSGLSRVECFRSGLVRVFFFFAEVLIVVIVAVAAWLRNRCKLSINQKNAPISQSRWGNSWQSPYTCRLPCYIYRIESSPFLSITFYDKLIKHELRTLATTGEMGKYDHFESI